MRAAVIAVLLTGACAGRYPARPAAAGSAVAGLPEVPRRCLVANHVHTIVSDRYSHAPGDANRPHAYSPQGLRTAIAEFTALGADAIVVTDHNAIDAIFDPQVAAARLEVIGGMEWTTRRGHALILGAAATSPADAILPPSWRARIGPADFRSMVDTTHARGGVVIIAHPRVPFRTWPDDTFGADGVEVWGLDNALMRNAASLRWWHERLVDGLKLVAIGGTDLHPGAGVRRHHHPLNWVYAPTCDEPAILAAIRAGHLLVVRGRDTPVVVLGAETGGAVDFADAREGDTLPAGDIDLQVRVVGGAKARLRLLGRAGVLLDRTVDAADESLRLRLAVRPGDFVRAELRRGRRLLAVGNPLYVR
ncbi:MAG TPA: CehA/McbA family metallohydrolase [Nannocystis sp.]